MAKTEFLYDVSDKIPQCQNDTANKLPLNGAAI